MKAYTSLGTLRGPLELLHLALPARDEPVHRHAAPRVTRERRVEWRRAATLLEDASARSSLPEADGREPRAPPRRARCASELREQLARAIEQLPEAARETLLLREVDGLSYAEIAEALGIPQGHRDEPAPLRARRVQELLLEAGVARGDERRLRAADGPEEES